ncbi:MAG: B12-binding domain-containing protein, partial [bacterium]
MNEDGLALKKILVREKRRFAELIEDRQVEMDPEYWKKFGPSGREAGIRDVQYHLDFLNSAIIMERPELFDDYAVWVKELFDRLGFPKDTVEKTLWCMREVLEENLSEALGKLTSRYIDRASEAVAKHEVEERSFLEGEGAMAKLRSLYLESLLQGNREAANTLIMTAADQGTAVGDIYLHILQPTQYEVGRLWQIGKVSVAKEHFCTAVTQEVMARLYPRIIPEKRTGRKAMIACVSGELHQGGA